MGGVWHCLLKPPERIVSLCSVLVLFMGCTVLHAYSAGSNRQRTSLLCVSPINRARVADRGSRTVSFHGRFHITCMVVGGVVGVGWRLVRDL